MAEMRLIDAPVGLFYSGRTLCVKTEYYTNGGVDAYIVSSGEYFHGGTQTSEERNNLMVRPVNQRNLRPMGRWIFTQEYSETLDIDLPWATCSACREYRINSAPFIKKPNYCPNCGARMKGENNG